ncbi:CRISPR-associated protein Csx16 [Rheinheimera sediminis]|uniref:CRISPR-associated protein Csx16 n=1 Tax=Rheinheimera sp. YQF-1 TaxID=2499626 RepID=UPI000FDC8399|nr:CRISPR-associated protein Csx16 [Rheinheimera sp. YQF-1]RVT47822.1 CRISPR-associated protein Csx16 [Rheinheimera sp. YQF-1]
MAIWLVSRHSGATAWIEQQGIAIDHKVSHLDADAVQSGDTVVGTLPIHMVAALNERGIYYVHLELNIPAHLRGQELTLQQMTEVGVSLVAYKAERDKRPILFNQLTDKNENC